MKNKPLHTCLLGVALATLSLSEATAQSTALEEKVYSYVDGMPAFKGGQTEMLNFIAGNMQYPQDAREAGLAGISVVSFIVETNGTLSDISMVKKLSASTDAEARRLAKLTEGKWSIGTQKGKPTRVRYTLPIRFSLDESGNPVVAHRMPQFKGGPEAMANAIQKNLSIPATAQKEGLNARLEVNFTITPDGQVANIAVADTKLKRTAVSGPGMDYMDATTFQVQNKAVLADLHKAAVEAIAATNGMWQPGIRNGKAIAAEVTLPVYFAAAGKTGANQQLETMMLTYQADAYDKKFAYDANEVDVQPSLQNETIEKFLAKHLRYPSGSFEGLVKVAFIVNSNGSIVGPMAYMPEEHQAVENEIKRVFQLTNGNWKPARKNTQPVASMQEVTIAFVNKGTPNTKPVTADVVVTK